jgi:kojibiose phosphorylase
MALSLGEDSEAYQSFMRTIEADIIDSQGSAGQGIHIASSAGGWMAAVLGFGGLKISSDGTLSFQSHLPTHWERLRFRVIWHDQILEIDLSPDAAKVKRLTSQAEKQNITVPILLNGQKVRC